MTSETIGAVLTNRLALCTVAQGAETDIGLTTYRGKRNISDDLIPCSCVIEGDVVKESRQGGRSTRYVLKSKFALHAYLPCDGANPNVAGHAAVRDMLRAVFSDSTLYDSVKDVEFESADIAPRADGAAFVLAVIVLSVTSTIDLSKP